MATSAARTDGSADGADDFPPVLGGCIDLNFLVDLMP
jgi:hypothetical protein